METVCVPDLYESSRLSKRSLIINTIIHERLFLDAYQGYFFYQSFPNLAKDSLSIGIPKEYKSVLENIDADLVKGFKLATSEKMKPELLWAVHMAMGAFGIALLAEILDEKDPFTIFRIVREFYRKKAVKTSTPFSINELKIAVPLDKRLGYPLSRFVELLALGKEKKHGDQKPYGYEALCVQDLVYSKVFSSNGYAYVPSHHSSLLAGYLKAFLNIDEELRKDVRLSEAFRANSAEESLRYLLGERVGELNELLGFTPLDPLTLVSKEISNEQVDEAVLKTRKDCKKVRELFEKVHVSCLKKEIDKAVDAKMKLADMKANQSINYSILDNMSEFMNRDLQDAIHKFVDNMMDAEIGSKVIKFHRSLKKLKTKSRWISEVKFLTFGTLFLLASCGIDAPYVKAIFDSFGKVSLGLGAAGVAIRILEEGMKLYPGFNIYTSFISWPKIV